MIDEAPLHDDEDSVEPGTIGVGMGGSCPNCRAPVDLGQEFCLECGSPIRFVPGKPRKKRSRMPAAAAPGPRKGQGFPWIPFLIVLALVIGGIAAFALVDDGAGSKATGSDTESTEAFPSITNTPPPETTTATSTTTLQDCDPAQPLDGTQPAVPNGGDLGAGGETVPSFEDSSGGLDDGSAFDDVPSIEPNDTSSSDATVTVDQFGNLCEDTGGLDGTTPPIDDAPTGDASSTTTSGDWPSGRDGWTVIVAGYDNEARAQQRAADVQEDGFSDSGVLLSTEFQSLCPGIYVVFSGTFTERAGAEDRLGELNALPDYAGMYVREVQRSGPAPSGCTTAN